jgi:hypothetical protein
MPTPTFIICSESAADDRDTGLASLFNLIDTFQVAKGFVPPQNPLGSNIIAQMRVTACWMRSDGDQDKEFEFEFVVKTPKGDEIRLGSGEFLFKTMFARISVKLVQIFPIIELGIFWVEARIHRLGASKGWLVQKTPICVQELPAPPSTEQESKDKETAHAE